MDIPTQSSHKLKATERPPQNHMEPKTYQAELYPLPYPEDHEKQTTKRPLTLVTEVSYLRNQTLDLWLGLRISGKLVNQTLQYSCLENPMDEGAW